MTPNIISLTTSRVPPSLKSSVVGILIGASAYMRFVSSHLTSNFTTSSASSLAGLGLIGSALGPLIVGLVAQKTGLAMLPGVLITVSGISIIGLIAVRGKKRED